jgi:hypothetical protein
LEIPADIKMMPDENSDGAQENCMISPPVDPGLIHGLKGHWHDNGVSSKHTGPYAFNMNR